MRTTIVSVAFVLVLGMVGMQATRGDLINPAFDGDGGAPSLNGWSVWGQGTAEADTTTPRSSPGVAKLYAGYGNYVVIFQDLAANEGEEWLASVYARTNSDDTIKGKSTVADLGIRFRDSSGNTIASDDLEIMNGADPNLVEDQWLHFSIGLTAPENTASVRIVMDVANGGWGSVLYDDTNLEIVPEPATLGLLAVGSGLFLARRRR